MGVFPYEFGKHCWEVKILSNALFMNNDVQNTLKVGVTTGKGKQVYGCSFSYSNGKGSFKLRVVLDIEAGIMMCYTPGSPNGEQFNVLPNGPLYPAFQNKPGRMSSSLKIMALFERTDS